MEGLELDVLMGAEYKISNEIKYILIEHKYGKQYEGSRKEMVHKFLQSKNFIIEKIFYPTFHFKDVLYKKLMAEREGSNPRNGFPFTRFPSVRLQPLGHLSIFLSF